MHKVALAAVNDRIPTGVESIGLVGAAATRLTQRCAVTDDEKRSEQQVVAHVLEEEGEEEKRESQQSHSDTQQKMNNLSAKRETEQNPNKKNTKEITAVTKNNILINKLLYI